jgi:hypothetical protein
LRSCRTHVAQWDNVNGQLHFVVYIRTYDDAVLLTQNDSQNNILNFGTPYAEHPIHVAGKKGNPGILQERDI